MSNDKRWQDTTPDEQAAAIGPILEKRFAGLQEAIRNEHDAIGKDIEALLTPEQREAHRRILEERRKRFLGDGCRRRGHD